jgi:uncharacterized membrane protein
MKRILLWCGFVLILLLLITSLALADTGYELYHGTVVGGGGGAGGGNYILSGSIAQPDAGQSLSGGDYVIEGGTWTSGNHVYLPLLKR